MAGELHRLDPTGTLGVGGRELETGATPRTKNPVYAVFKRQTDRSFALVSGSVPAPSRQRAIELSTGDGGEFMVVPTKEIWTVKRSVKTERVSQFT